MSEALGPVAGVVLQDGCTQPVPSRARPVPPGPRAGVLSGADRSGVCDVEAHPGPLRREAR